MVQTRQGRCARRPQQLDRLALESQALSLLPVVAYEEGYISGYTMALYWCLRCDVGGLKMVECWCCGQEDEVRRWKFAGATWVLAPL
jgi:hypothetical protein